MSQDIIDLQKFYTTALGQQTQALLAALTLPMPAGPTLVLGMATPWLEALASRPETVLAMPAVQGAVAWPAGLPNQAVMVDEAQLPFAAEQFATIIVMHSLEHTASPLAVLQECCRLLRPNGQLMLVVPARRGLWARFDHTPFGMGRPFSPKQLRDFCEAAGLHSTGYQGALFWPPCQWPLRPNWLQWLEQQLRRWCSAMGGVLIWSASRQVYAPVQRVQRSALLFSPLAKLRPNWPVPQSRAACTRRSVN